jgi:hypothetical protein
VRDARSIVCNPDSGLEQLGGGVAVVGGSGLGTGLGSSSSLHSLAQQAQRVCSPPMSTDANTPVAENW